jgi:hypothetical protein
MSARLSRVEEGGDEEWAAVDGVRTGGQQQQRQTKVWLFRQDQGVTLAGVLGGLGFGTAHVVCTSAVRDSQSYRNAVQMITAMT